MNELRWERVDTEVPGLRLHKGSSSWWVHSPRNPVREAERALELAGEPCNTLLVILGGGLGYLVRSAREQGFRNIIVLEPDGSETLEELRELPEDTKVCRGNHETLLRSVTQHQMQVGWIDRFVVCSPAYTRAFPDWVDQLARVLGLGRQTSQMHGLVRQLSSPVKKTLILDSGYYCLDDCSRAFVELGLSVTRLPIEGRTATSPTLLEHSLEASSDYVDRLLQAIQTDRPDFVFCVNHLGVDKEGRIAELLSSLNIALIVWYVDSPRFILDGVTIQDDANSKTFCWEKAWMPFLVARGFHDVRYLPLGASDRFQLARRKVRDLGFVAGSNSQACAKWLEKLPLGKMALTQLDELVAVLQQLPADHLPEQDLRACLQEPRYHELARSVLPKHFTRLFSYVILKLTMLDRLSLVQAFKAGELDLRGDKGWRGLAPAHRPGAPVDYITELPDYYAGTRITLNVTSRQMPEAVNQRVFDAPLADCLVLSDSRRDLERHFGELADGLSWGPGESPRDLAGHWLEHADERKERVAGLKDLVLKRHMMVHRMAAVLQTLEEGEKQVAGAA